MWLLGSSTFSAQLAHSRLSFSLRIISLHRELDAALATYRKLSAFDRAFRASRDGPVSVIVPKFARGEVGCRALPRSASCRCEPVVPGSCRHRRRPRRTPSLHSRSRSPPRQCRRTSSAIKKTVVNGFSPAATNSGRRVHDLDRLHSLEARIESHALVAEAWGCPTHSTRPSPTDFRATTYESSSARRSSFTKSRATKPKSSSVVDREPAERRRIAWMLTAGLPAS